MQMQANRTAAASANELYFSGIIDCYSKLLRHHGVKSFYRGLGAQLVKTGPSSAVQFTVSEYAKHALSGFCDNM